MKSEGQTINVQRRLSALKTGEYEESVAVMTELVRYYKARIDPAWLEGCRTAAGRELEEIQTRLSAAEAIAAEAGPKLAAAETRLRELRAGAVIAKRRPGRDLVKSKIERLRRLKAEIKRLEA